VEIHVAERRIIMAEKPKKPMKPMKPIKNLKPITAQVKGPNMAKYNTKGKKK
jgi:hypothetical protein